MKPTNRQKKHARNMAIASLGISFALIITLHALAEGFAHWGLFSLALGIIPVLAISQLKDWRYGLLLGTFFGIVSLLTALIKGYAGLPVWHNLLNPLVTVLPRAVVGVTCSLLASLAAYVTKRVEARKLRNETPIDPPDEEDDVVTETKGQNHTAKKVGKITVEYLINAAITLVGVVLNAVGFLGILLLLARGEQLNGADFNLMYVLQFVVGTNTLIEAIVFTVLVPAIIQALKRAKVFAVR